MIESVLCEILIMAAVFAVIIIVIILMDLLEDISNLSWGREPRDWWNDPALYQETENEGD